MSFLLGIRIKLLSSFVRVVYSGFFDDRLVLQRLEAIQLAAEEDELPVEVLSLQI